MTFPFTPSVTRFQVHGHVNLPTHSRTCPMNASTEDEEANHCHPVFIYRHCTSTPHGTLNTCASFQEWRLLGWMDEGTTYRDFSTHPLNDWCRWGCALRGRCMSRVLWKLFHKNVLSVPFYTSAILNTRNSYYKFTLLYSTLGRHCTGYFFLNVAASTAELPPNSTPSTKV